MDEKEKKVKGINLAIHETRESMIGILNSSALPPSCLMLILSEITSLVTSLNEQCIKKEAEEFYDSEGGTSSLTDN